MLLEPDELSLCELLLEKLEPEDELTDDDEPLEEDRLDEEALDELEDDSLEDDMLLLLLEQVSSAGGLPMRAMAQATSGSSRSDWGWTHSR